MRAGVCKVFGPPEALVVEDVPSRALGKSEVRIAVKAAGVNFPDTLIIQGKYQLKAEPPFTPGAEVAGTVVEAGEKVKNVIAGDAAWEAFPEEAKQIFTGNSPAIVAEIRGGYLDVSPEQLGTIGCPTLLVAGKGSPPAFAEVIERIADAMPTARVEWVDGGHLISPAHPAVLRFVDGLLGRS